MMGRSPAIDGCDDFISHWVTCTWKKVNDSNKPNMHAIFDLQLRAF